MTNSRRDYVDQPGSERAAHPLATIEQPPVDPEEHATVTIGSGALGAIATVREARTKIAANGGESVNFERVLQKVLWRLVTEGSILKFKKERSEGVVAISRTARAIPVR